MARMVFCSCPREEAEGLARSIVEARLAACVQIVPVMESFYWWKGELCHDQEALLLCKTSGDLAADLTNFIKTQHSYEVPEVLSVEVLQDESNSDYLAWLQETLKSQMEKS